MTPEELAEIRERDAHPADEPLLAWVDRRALLAHIDALTEAVEGLLVTWDERAEHSHHAHAWSDAAAELRAAVLAILRGER